MLGIATNRRDRIREGREVDGRRVDWTVIVACFVLAAGVAGLVFGVLGGVTGDERAGLPDEVESVTPVPHAAQALSQTAVFVDLAPSYFGELMIDTIAIPTIDIADIGRTPGQQVDLPPVAIYEGGNATLTFTPSADAPIEEFSQGRHTVRLTYWPISEGRQAARTFTWTFDVV